MSLHSAQTKIHIPVNWNYADSAARLADATPVTADIGKLAFQVSNDTFWRLKALGTPNVWTAVGSAGGAALGVTDGTTSVPNVTSIVLSGATVSSGGTGIADIAIAGGGGGGGSVGPARFVGMVMAGGDQSPYFSSPPLVTIFGGFNGTAITQRNPYDTSGVTNPAPLAVYQNDAYCSAGNQLYWRVSGWQPGANVVVRTHHVTDNSPGSDPSPRTYSTWATGKNYVPLANAHPEDNDNKVHIFSGNVIADSDGTILLYFRSDNSYTSMAAWDMQQ